MHLKSGTVIALHIMYKYMLTLLHNYFSYPCYEGFTKETAWKWFCPSLYHLNQFSCPLSLAKMGHFVPVPSEVAGGSKLFEINPKFELIRS